MILFIVTSNDTNTLNDKLNIVMKRISSWFHNNHLVLNTLRTAGWEKILQPGRQGFLNARRVTKQAVLLEKLVQQGHKLKM
jgi:hypothetical protein